MTEPTFQAKALVLYKERPALITHVDDKLELLLPDDKSLKVRYKDVTPLHPGPLDSLADLTPPPGEIKTAWELLCGHTTHLAELAELAYGEYSPESAWATWELLEDGLYFQGTVDEIVVVSAEAVAAEQAARAEKIAKEQAWDAFVQRVQRNQLAEDDGPRLRGVEAVAVGKQTKSRLLRALNLKETPETAHRLLLKLGHWDYTNNPYPIRYNIPLEQPEFSLPPLPDEPRHDLTHLPAFAIDDEGSTDPDDAISLEGSRLWVHVADVAALVTVDSPVDLEARARGATYYLPEATIPMLPPAAVPQLGLGLNEVSPALSFGIELDEQGTIAQVEIVRSWVKVTRLTYGTVEPRLTRAPKNEEDELLQTIYKLGERHRQRRMENGAVSLDFPEVKVRVEEEGTVKITLLESLKSRELVAESMIMVGAAAAQFAIARDIPFPFSTQPYPEPLDNPPPGLAGMFAVRRTLSSSQMKSSPAPHAALGLSAYSQATSPLRRYLDLVVHQQLRAYLRDQPLLSESEMLTRVAAAESVRGTARNVERNSYKHWTMAYFMQNPQWEGEAVVVEKRDHRGYVIIPELAFETRIHLPGDYDLNDTVLLHLKKVNLTRLEAYFKVVGDDSDDDDDD